MARLLRPKKINGSFMTAQALYALFECTDRWTGELFLPEDDAMVVEQNQVETIFICRHLIVNCFMLMAKLAQYWVVDFYSCVLDQNQRLSIVGKIKSQIMMGQPWTKSTELTVLEEEDRDAACYTNPDVPKKELYLPGSIHGSPHHTAALAKNALVLVSEWGCPHIFLALTCNPK